MFFTDSKSILSKGDAIKIYIYEYTRQSTKINILNVYLVSFSFFFLCYIDMKIKECASLLC